MIGKCFIRLATEVCMGFEPKIEIQKLQKTLTATPLRKFNNNAFNV